MFSFRLGKYPTARLWHPTVSVCLTLSKVGELFSRVAGLFCIPTSSGRELELLPILASTWPCQLQFLWKYWQPCYLARKPRQQGCATYLLCLLTKYLDQDLTSEPWTVQIRFSLMFSLNPIPLPPPTSMAFGKTNSLGNMGTETRNPTVTGESRQAWSSLKNLYFPPKIVTIGWVGSLLQSSIPRSVIIWSKSELCANVFPQDIHGKQSATII